MGITDNIKHTAEDMKGRAKEAAGAATGNDRLTAEGKLDQAEARVKKTADKVTDAFTE